MRIYNLTDNDDAAIVAQQGIFQVMEWKRDFSVTYGSAMDAYYASEMNVRRRQLVCNLNGKTGAVVQAGAMQWTVGHVEVTTGVKGACETTIQQHAVMVSRPSAMVAGGEGLFNLSLMGQGTVALESPVPASEIVTVDLENDELKVDGNFAIAWTNGLQFTVERSTKTLIGSAASGEGLVNVYRGTGRVLLAPVAANLANPNAGSGAA